MYVSARELRLVGCARLALVATVLFVIIALFAMILIFVMIAVIGAFSGFVVAVVSGVMMGALMVIVRTTRPTPTPHLPARGRTLWQPLLNRDSESIMIRALAT